MSKWRAWLNKCNPSVADRCAWLGLRLLSLPYAIVIWFRNRSYDLNPRRAFRAALPVVSVGNLSVGGTGKSPMVAWLARWFRDRDVRVAILSRGYGQLEDGRNDEALELELLLPDVPHLQNRDRIASAMLATEELEMEMLILDDGFQHRRLARDLDLVLIDATDSAAASWMLPAGLRREPLSSLRRASLVVITRCDMVPADRLEKLQNEISRYVPRSQCCTAQHQPTCLLQHPAERRELSSLRGATVLAFCGIGNPEGFFESLRRLGANVVETRTWPDHHAYTAADIDWLGNWRSELISATLVCTIKDWVKIQEPQIGPRPLAALQIELSFTSGQDELEATLEKLIQASAPEYDSH